MNHLITVEANDHVSVYTKYMMIVKILDNYSQHLFNKIDYISLDLKFITKESLFKQQLSTMAIIAFSLHWWLFAGLTV